MKKIIAAAVLVLFGGLYAKASNYPSDHTYQTARVVSAGPAIAAGVSSGIMNKLVIGYKSSGILGGADSINAVVRIAYSDYDGYVRTEERIVHLSKEWNGTGFMTVALSPYDLVNNTHLREILKIELAFFDGPRWDSNYGANYTVIKDDFYRNAAIFRSASGGGTDIGLPCWDFIVDQLRK